VLEIQVYGDSKLTIDWLKGSIQLVNLDLQLLGQRLKLISTSFNHINFMHIFRELNSFVDILSKEALYLPKNQMVMEVFSDGELISKREGNFFQYILLEDPYLIQSFG
jgi:hypothetical protein